MRRLLKFVRRRDGCTCDSRFAWVAADIDCPTHGLKATVLADEPVGGDASLEVATDTATSSIVAADNLHDDDCWIACPHPDTPVVIPVQEIAREAISRCMGCGHRRTIGPSVMWTACPRCGSTAVSTTFTVEFGSATFTQKASSEGAA